MNKDEKYNPLKDPQFYIRIVLGLFLTILLIILLITQCFNKFIPLTSIKDYNYHLQLHSYYNHVLWSNFAILALRAGILIFLVWGIIRVFTHEE